MARSSRARSASARPSQSRAMCCSPEARPRIQGGKASCSTTGRVRWMARRSGTRSSNRRPGQGRRLTKTARAVEPARDRGFQWL